MISDSDSRKTEKMDDDSEIIDMEDIIEVLKRTSASKFENMEKRIVEKDGTVNVIEKPKNQWFLVLVDYTILLRMRWTSFFVLSFLAFLFSFLLAGGLIHGLKNLHKHKENLNYQSANTDYDFKTFNNSFDCFEGVDEYGDAFMLAMETMFTIGYGSRAPKAACPEATFVTMLMSFWSLLLITLFSGIFLAKFTMQSGVSRIRFSRHAVVTKMRDPMGKENLYFMIRIGDPMSNGSDLVDINAFACLNKRVDEDELSVTSRIHILHIGGMHFSYTIDRVNSRVPLMFPMCIFHKMDEESPLYALGPGDLKTSKLEIVVKASGARSDSGGTIFSTTSYVNKEIVWGHRFDDQAVLFKVNFRGLVLTV